MIRKEDKAHTDFLSDNVILGQAPSTRSFCRLKSYYRSK